MMAKAVWNGMTLAESDDIALVEGNPYFPKSSVNWDLFRDSETAKPTYCHWKGTATYYDIAVGGETNEGPSASRDTISRRSPTALVSRRPPIRPARSRRW